MFGRDCTPTTLKNTDIQRTNLMTCANRMGQAAKRVSDFALGGCGGLLIWSS